MIRLTIPDIGSEELEVIQEVLESGYLVQGEKVKLFEKMIADYLGVKHAVVVSSGTAALHLALLTLGIGPTNEVIVPSFTFPATANAVELVGATTCLVDIDLNSFCIDPTQVESLINKNTKAIIPVHEFGQAADLGPILSLAKKYGLQVIEDAACALGTEYRGVKVGSIGQVGCFSLHPRKAITTGEGGVVTTNDPEIADKVRILRNHGMTNLNGKTQFVKAGFNYRMTEIQAAIGIVQMKKLNEIILKRRQIAARYNLAMENEPLLTIPRESEYGLHIFQTYHLLVDQVIDRDRLISHLKEMDIETNYGAYAVHMQPYYRKKYAYKDTSFKNSTTAYLNGLALPLHSKLSDQEVDRVINAIKLFLAKSAMQT